MKQFDIFSNPFPGSKNEEPYLVSLQSDYFESLPTIVVASLTRPSAIKPAGRLTPQIEFAGEPFLIVVWNIASISRARLGPPVGSLEAHRYHIISALDLLFTGV